MTILSHAQTGPPAVRSAADAATEAIEALLAQVLDDWEAASAGLTAAPRSDQEAHVIVSIETLATEMHSAIIARKLVAGTANRTELALLMFRKPAIGL
jgi:protein-tyrosine-phosphatase